MVPEAVKRGTLTLICDAVPPVIGVEVVFPLKLILATRSRLIPVMVIVSVVLTDNGAIVVITGFNIVSDAEEFTDLLASVLNFTVSLVASTGTVTLI